MGLFRTLNECVVALIDKRSATNRLLQVEFEVGHIVLRYADGSTRPVLWSGLNQVAAIRRDLYAGEEVSVLLEFADLGVVEVPASCKGWLNLCSAIEKLDGSKPFGNWHSEILSASFDRVIYIWSREP